MNYPLSKANELPAP